ncbi:MAG: LytTR family DNA-binding domain-containing protein [Eubacteriales bacterium]|nr:LytTR family DNA-binding domain-containing protein [Eubacteriales bacterium]
MRIAIIEDNPVHRQLIMDLVVNWQATGDPSGEVREFPSAQAFLFAAEDEPFDLLLVDIMMPDMSGMELAKKLRLANNRTLIVFLTAEASFVFEGYKVEALDYLLKPVNKKELEKVLDRAKLQCKREPAKILVETPDGYQSLELSRIIYLEAQDKEIVFYLHSETPTPEQLRIRATLQTWIEKIEESLEPGMVFCQPHRSYYCNLAWVVRVEPTLLHLVQDQTVPLARSRKQDFMEAYFTFCRQRQKDRS